MSPTSDPHGFDPASLRAPDSLAGVLAETIALNEQVGKTLTLLRELAVRAEVQALDPQERADLAAQATQVSPIISRVSATVAEARERLRFASGLRRRS